MASMVKCEASTVQKALKTGGPLQSGTGAAGTRCPACGPLGILQGDARWVQDVDMVKALVLDQLDETYLHRFTETALSEIRDVDEDGPVASFSLLRRRGTSRGISEFRRAIRKRAPAPRSQDSLRTVTAAARAATLARICC